MPLVDSPLTCPSWTVCHALPDVMAWHHGHATAGAISTFSGLISLLATVMVLGSPLGVCASEGHHLQQVCVGRTFSAFPPFSLACDAHFPHIPSLTAKGACLPARASCHCACAQLTLRCWRPNHLSALGRCQPPILPWLHTILSRRWTRKY